MKLFRMLSVLLRNKEFLKRSAILRSFTSVNVNFINSPLVGSKFLPNKVNKKCIHTDSDNEDLYEDPTVIENEMDHCGHVRNILFKDYQDDIITELNACVSVEEVLNLIVKYKNAYNDKHVLQTLLVLKDLQKIYVRFNGFRNTAPRVVNDKLDLFDPDYLSHVLYYLYKLGIPAEDNLLQRVALKVRDNLLQNFCLHQCARFLTVIFSENSVRPYYLSSSIAPLVIDGIENCSSVDDLQSLTVCLNKFHKIVTIELLEKYKAKVVEFLENKKLADSNHSTLLKIMLLLNYPEWRDKNILLISNCILQLKDKINSLNVVDFTILYEIFFKNQEPGIILNDIQRCSAKFLNQLDEETGTTENATRLKLFSSLIYFSSPLHRIKFRSQMPKYLNICHSYSELIQLRKIFSYVKVSDMRLCANYWNLCLEILNESADPNVTLKLCQNYMYFNTDINNYRHYEFENSIMSQIRKSLASEVFLNPTKISAYLSFAIVYSKRKDSDLLTVLLSKLEENLNCMKPLDCLRISHSISLLDSGSGTYMSQKQIEKTKALLNKSTRNLLEIHGDSYVHNSVLLKGLIFRNDLESDVLERLFANYKEMEYMSSKIIEHFCHISVTTRSLMPEIINKCTEYVVRHKDNILGFNAEKILTLCYYLGYHPVHGDKFFEVVTNVIIRDQERLSGLAFLQSALSLCYFNKLPSSFVKQVFNVEFLEKLDTELEHCYSKDKYPQRVRKVLMMLNRAVCLEYPEYNVPWFHKKYLDDMKKKLVKTDGTFQQRVKEYLVQVLGTRQYISEHVVTPYGYYLNFTVNLNSKEEVVPSNSPDINRRVAILLYRQHAFTRFCVHLMGKHQLQKRHLEIFGYDVAIINFTEWVSLLYGEERLEYISKLIWPSGRKSMVDVIGR